MRGFPARSESEVPKSIIRLTGGISSRLSECGEPDCVRRTAQTKDAEDDATTRASAAAVHELRTAHRIVLADATNPQIWRESVDDADLVVTSPPYWNLKAYPERVGQLGWIGDYEEFLERLLPVWQSCYEALTPGGRLATVVGDVCLSRRRNKGRRTVVPLHASIQEQSRQMRHQSPTRC